MVIQFFKISPLETLQNPQKTKNKKQKKNIYESLEYISCLYLL